MGIEYSLRFANPPDADRLAVVLRDLPTARARSPQYGGFDLGVDESASGWPAATVVPEADGVYFCDHLTGAGPAQLGVVVARLSQQFGPVTVSEL